MKRAHLLRRVHVHNRPDLERFLFVDSDGEFWASSYSAELGEVMVFKSNFDGDLGAVHPDDFGYRRDPLTVSEHEERLVNLLNEKPVWKDGVE